MSELGKIALDSLVAGPFRTKRVNIKSGQGVLKKGTILGRIKYSVPTTGTLAGTGNGTCTLVEPRKGIIPGTYTIDQSTILTLTSQAAAGVVVFSVTNPNGKLLGSFNIGLATSDVVDFDSDEIAFRITNGSTDFAADSVFTIAVTEGVPNTGSAGSNTGNGLCQIVRGGPDVMVGTYTATCIEAVTNGGKFRVTNPDGNNIGEFYVRNFTGTGNGTITQIIPGKNKKPGRYVVKCTAALANGGTFTVTDPEGVLVDTLVLTVDTGHGTLPTYFYSDDISFKMTVGATDYLVDDEFKIDVLDSTELIMEITDNTDFIVGDSFTVAVTIGAYDCGRQNYANVNGTQEPYAVLYEDVDATSADVAAAAIIGGQVVERELILATPDFDALPRLKADLRAIGIEVVGSVTRDPV
jgi:hypothetical protein